MALEELPGEVPGLGVIVYKGGVEIFSKFQGLRDVKKNKPVTRETRFRAASVSKMFTVFTLMQLVERGVIDLDADVSWYLNFELKNPLQPRRKITARMLASHTSSLRDGKIYSSPPNISVAEFFKPDGKFFEGGAHFAAEKIGEYFSYSNLNYGLLGTIIEAVTGERFDLYQRKNILQQLDTEADYVPANLSGTAFENLGVIYQKKNPAGVWNEHGAWFGKADDFSGIQPAADTLTLQNPYAENFQQVYDLSDYRAGVNATIFSPQGGLRISFEELAHALEFLMNGGNFRGRQILRRESVAELLKSQWLYAGNGDTCNGALVNYGLGTYVCKDFALDLAGHTGQAFGLYSGIFFVPGTHDGFVYMLNGAPFAEEDSRSAGKFSGNFIWEEKIMSAAYDLIKPTARQPL